MSDRLGSPQLFISDVDGLNATRIPNQQSYFDSPAWSPRGDRIVYTARTGRGYDIFVTTLDGSIDQRLTHGLGLEREPTLVARRPSHRVQLITQRKTRGVRDDRGRLGSAPADPERSRVLLPDVVSPPAWSSDGEAAVRPRRLPRGGKSAGGLDWLAERRMLPAPGAVGGCVPSAGGKFADRPWLGGRGSARHKEVLRVSPSEP